MGHKKSYVKWVKQEGTCVGGDAERRLSSRTREGASAPKSNCSVTAKVRAPSGPFEFLGFGDGELLHPFALFEINGADQADGGQAEGNVRRGSQKAQDGGRKQGRRSLRVERKTNRQLPQEIGHQPKAPPAAYCGSHVLPVPGMWIVTGLPDLFN